MKRITAGIALSLLGLAVALLLLALEVRDHARSLATDAALAGAAKTAPAPPSRRHHGSRAGGRGARRSPGRPRPAPSLLPPAGALLGMLRDAIEGAGAPEISRSLRDLTGIDEEDLRARGIDPKGFALRLLDVAVRGTTLDAGAVGGEPPPPGSILFSSSASERGGPLAPTRTFAVTDLRILAWIPAGSLEGRSRVLVKWLHASSGRLEMLRQLYVGPDRGDGFRPVALRRIQGWTPGWYVVEILGTEGSLPPLGAGSFEVVREPRDPTSATSSLELLAEDPDRGDAAPLDAVTPGTRRFFLAVRVAPGTGVPPAPARMLLRGSWPRGPSSVLEPRQGRPDSPWLVAPVDVPPGLAPGLVTAELRIAGQLLERNDFRVLDRDPR